MSQPVQTITIDNFDGALTPNLFGDLNSGLCPILSTNNGVNPFWHPFKNSLAFMSNATSTVGGTLLVDPIMRMVAKGVSNTLGTASDPYMYGVGLNGNFYRVQASDVANAVPDLNNILAYTNNLTASATLKYGGGITFYGNNLYAGYDQGVSYVTATGSPIADASWTPVTSAGGLAASRPRPLVSFVGNLYAGNDNNIAESTNGTSFSSVAKISPAFPLGWVVRDLAVSSDGRYMIIVASGPINSLLDLDISGGNGGLVSPIDSAIATWNGSDIGFSSLQIVKGTNLSSITASNYGNFVFGKDEEGVGIWDLNGNRIASLFDNTSGIVSVSSGAAYPPVSNFVSGKKVFFLAQYATTAYLYCYDMESGKLYPIWSQSETVEFVKGACVIPSVHSQNISGSDLTRSKIFFSLSKTPIATQSNNLLYSLHLQNYSGDTAQNSTYTTQIQKFPKKISVKQIRVYCAPTAANNAFSLFVIGEKGGAIVGSSNSYTYTAGTDATLGQGSLDLIKFYPQHKEVGQLGIQINNTGSVGMVIHKIEIDYIESETPKTSN